MVGTWACAGMAGTESCAEIARSTAQAHPEHAPARQGRLFPVIPAQAGIQNPFLRRSRMISRITNWIPAFAGMTGSGAFAGVAEVGALE